MRDRHHILHSKQEWSLRPYARQLRGTPSLIPTLERDAHEALHRNCPPVPLLGQWALQGTVMRFTPSGDTFKDIDHLLSCIERATRGERFHPLERELAGLAIEAVDLQRPYLREGML